MAFTEKVATFPGTEKIASAVPEGRHPYILALTSIGRIAAAQFEKNPRDRVEITANAISTAARHDREDAFIPPLTPELSEVLQDADEAVQAGALWHNSTEWLYRVAVRESNDRAIDAATILLGAIVDHGNVRGPSAEGQVQNG